MGGDYKGANNILASRLRTREVRIHSTSYVPLGVYELQRTELVRGNTCAANGKLLV
jgi:hypothetical protein